MYKLTTFEISPLVLCCAESLERVLHRKGNFLELVGLGSGEGVKAMIGIVISE